jgi:hypothetical protein
MRSTLFRNPTTMTSMQPPNRQTSLDEIGPSTCIHCQGYLQLLIDTCAFRPTTRPRTAAEPPHIPEDPALVGLPEHPGELVRSIYPISTVWGDRLGTM